MKMNKCISFILTLCAAILGIAGCRPATPVPPQTLEDFRTSVQVIQLRCMEEPLITVGEVSDKFRRLAEQAATNPEYERKCRKQAAAAYRIYAAHLIIAVGGPSKPARARDAGPWLDRAIRVNADANDFRDLKLAGDFFRSIAEERVTSFDPQTYIEHVLRVAMVEGTAEQVSEKVNEFMGVMRVGHSSTISRDVDYLESQGKGGPAIKAAIMLIQQSMQERHPGKEVGSFAPCYMNTLPNGNTCVRYKFYGDEVTILLEWEVNAEKKIILPKTEGARAIMKAAGLDDQP